MLAPRYLAALRATARPLNSARGFRTAPRAPAQLAHLLSERFPGEDPALLDTTGLRRLVNRQPWDPATKQQIFTQFAQLKPLWKQAFESRMEPEELAPNDVNHATDESAAELAELREHGERK